MSDHIDYHEAIRQMHQGNVVQYVGTVNGPVWNLGLKFCMQRGVVFLYIKDRVQPKSYGNMVYDPDFRYILTGETVDPREWPNKTYNRHRELTKALGYSRIGLNNV